MYVCMYIYICVYYVNDCNYIICAYTVNMYTLGFDLVSIASLRGTRETSNGTSKPSRFERRRNLILGSSW